MAKKETSKTDLLYDKIIILKSVYDKVLSMKYYIQPCKDPKTGLFPPCVKKVDSHGDMIMSEKEKAAYSEGEAVFFPEDHIFEISSGKTYNLDNIWDKAEWECIKNCRIIAKERRERDANGNFVIDGVKAIKDKPGRNGVAELYIYRPGLETAQEVSRKQRLFKAQSYIFNDERGADGQVTKAKLLGKDMSNQPIADVLDFLLRVAEKNPDKIIELYEGNDTNLRLLFIDAKDKKVIYIKNKLYLYGDNIVLGATDDAVIAWMKDPKNKKVLSLIEKDTYPEYFSEEEQA